MIVINIYTFRKILQCTFGFRECAQLIKIAQQTNCEIKILRGSQESSTKSITSLMSLGLMENMTVTFQIINGDQSKAFHLINLLIKQGWNVDDSK